MRILSIDGSTTATGYALFEDGKLIDYGVIKSEKSDWRLRIFDMSDTLSKYIEKHKPIDRIYMEDVPLKQGTTKTTLMLGVLQGTMMGMAVTHGSFIEFISVGTWRKKVGLFDGNGIKREDMKFKSIEKANELFGLNLKWVSKSSKKNEDDISDSILIGWSQINPIEEKPKRRIGKKVTI